MTPSPFFKHQMFASRLHLIIGQYVKINNLGEVCFSPLDVIFDDGMHRFQPDLLFIRKENTSAIKDWIRIVPDMVCEIISPGSYERDTEVKKSVYEKNRVPEYWLVMPEIQTIEILTIEGDKYKLHSMAALDGAVTSKVIEGLIVNVKEIFE
ncbi:MAG: Uma2 family endonuclease, partial [Nitrospirae bacterium]|nr:Uma2 family endonuclease [Nitrospirota bacterium]